MLLLSNSYYKFNYLGLYQVIKSWYNFQNITRIYEPTDGVWTPISFWILLLGGFDSMLGALIWSFFTALMLSRKTSNDLISNYNTNAMHVNTKYAIWDVTYDTHSKMWILSTVYYTEKDVCTLQRQLKNIKYCIVSTIC